MDMQGSKNYDNSSSKPKSIPHKLFVCKYCGRIFLNAQALGGHQNAHKKEKQEAQIYKEEIMRSMMMANPATLLFPYSVIQPHGVAQHQITAADYPSFSRAWSSNSLVVGSSSQYPHPVTSNYWPGSYRLEDRSGTPYSHVPDVGSTEEIQEKQIEKESTPITQESELPDLNLDPPL
ncbi:hypothetical protein BVRB_016580 [Beta vulgaris subsp. vulgaris]|uniref:C2H2-type domain-containing protein n=1 Tax=Beta vulgaris subsp. vulgaris TaxID=3555 RepID=A0A0J8DUZ7_BETVV|nr:hypothetical protein BVRB_016580 [Beta vulgaris subsp. vulgaris]